jgi:cation transport regulator ChaC
VAAEAVVRKVWTFFYGSFMNPAVLAKADVHPTELRKARLDGWELTIAPRANLAPSKRGAVFGILAQLTHAELDKLYTKDWFGFGTYLPEAVVVTDANGRQVPAMCYVAWQAASGKPTEEYIERMVSIAHAYSFPDDYIRHIESFL